MRFRFYILLITIFFSAFTSVFARKFTFTSTQSGSLSTTFQAGDTIILTNGNWHNKPLTFRGNGSSLQPVVFMAESAGGVEFTGNSTLTIDGSNVIVSGLKYTGPTTTGSSHIITFSKASNNCRLTNSAIIRYNPADSNIWATTDKKWVSLNGTNNRVDHCYFEGKGNMGTLLVVWLESGKSANHRIDSNHFYKRVSLLDSSNKELNGQEIIRVGDSNTSMTFANCVIENNFFEECNGEIETISNKSCGNIYRNNVFYKNTGMLTLRHGNDCEVYGNYFLGENVSGSGGVRIIGENHLVYNNYFQNLTGSGYRTAICIVNGKTNSALNEYFQVKNAQIAFNTFYKCSNVYNVGYQGGNDLPPIGTTIGHNVIFANTSSQTGVQISNSNSEVTWKNNLMYLGRFVNFTPTPQQFDKTSANLNFEQSDNTYGIYKPTSQSMFTTNYLTTDYPQITTDLEGKNRPSERMIGAFELNGTPNISMPTPKTIGCSFIFKDATGLFPILQKSNNLVINVRSDGSILFVDSDYEKLNAKIYSVKGELVSVLKTTGTSNSFQLPENLAGLYIFTFDNGKQTQSVKLIL